LRPIVLGDGNKARAVTGHGSVVSEEPTDDNVTHLATPSGRMLFVSKVAEFVFQITHVSPFTHGLSLAVLPHLVG
jgi:hypothetical protein